MSHYDDAFMYLVCMYLVAFVPQFSNKLDSTDAIWKKVLLIKNTCTCLQENSRMLDLSKIKDTC